MIRLTILESLILLRRWWGLPLLALLLGVAAGVVAWDVLPREYEAQTTILVAPPQIPQSYVRSTISDDMAIRLHSLQEAVLSRPYLQRIAGEVYGINPDDKAFDDWQRAIREKIVVELIEYDRRRGTGVFRIVFRDNDPIRAAHLVNRLAELYIAENVRLRTAQAQSTADTLRELAEEVHKELAAKEEAIARFRSAHLYELEDYLQSNLNLLEARRSELESIEQSLATARDHLKLLELQSTTGTPVGDLTDPLLRRKAELENELRELRARYTDQNPLVRSRLAELEEIQRQLAARRPRSSSDEPASGHETDPIALQIERTRAQIRRLEAERDHLKRSIQLLQDRIEATPRVTQRLKELMKGYEVLQERYEKYRKDYEEARGAVRIEQERRGSQFEIIERAVAPRRPIRPRAWLVFSVSIALSLLLFLGPMIAWHVFRPVTVTRYVLELSTGMPVVAMIPPLPGTALARTRFARLMINVLLLLLGATLLWVTVDPSFRGFLHP